MHNSLAGTKRGKLLGDAFSMNGGCELVVRGRSSANGRFWIMHVCSESKCQDVKCIKTRQGYVVVFC